MKRIAFIIALMWTFSLFAQNDSFINKKAIEKYATSYKPVNDFEGIMTEEELKELTKIINDYTKATSYHLSVVTVGDITPYPNLRSFAKDLDLHWKIGKKNEDDELGLLIVFSKAKRGIEIISDYKGERVISQSQLQQIINQKMLPYFSKKQFFAGIKHGVVSCMQAWERKAKASG